MPSSGNVEEVGVRLLVEGGATFSDAFAKATESVAAFNKETAVAIRRQRTIGRVMPETQAKVTAALDKTDGSLTAATDRTAAFSAEQAKAAESAKALADAQARAAKVSRDSATSIARSQRITRDAMLGGAAGRKVGGAAAAYTASWKHATKAATKIVKVGMLGVTAVAYEGIKKYMTFQQQMAQLAVDAGVKKSQLPAFEKIAMNISNATGLAATSVGDMMYRIASANPKIHMTTKAMKAMATQAGNLYVMAGNTGNYDQIARAYGAVVSNGLALKHGGKALGYTNNSAKAINEWILSTVGHGDMKTGDLVAAMGTGILPVAKTYGLSLNQVGAMLDVLSPAMNASAAATRLKTAIGMLGSPSQKASQGFELAGGNATTMAGLLRSRGPEAAMGYLASLENKALSGKSFIGGGIFGAESGKYSGFKGAGYWLKAYGFTNPKLLATLQSKGAKGLEKLSPTQLSAMGFNKGTTGMQAAKIVLSDLIGGIFGGGHTGAAIMQLVNERGVLGGKHRALTAMETPTAYEKALKLAFNEPIVKWNKFKQQVENVTIAVGKDLTPAFDGLLSTLEKIGHWFGANKWALKALGYLAGGVFGGALAIKGASAMATGVRGATSIVKVLTHPVTAMRGITGKSGLAGAAGELTSAATDLKAAATSLKGAAGAEEGALGGGEALGATGMARLKSKGAKLLGRGALAFAGATAYDAMIAPAVSKYLGKGMGTKVNDVFRDAAVGGTLGSSFGMWGGIAGSLGGALVGAFQAIGFKGIGRDLKHAAHDLEAIARKLGLTERHVKHAVRNTGHNFMYDLTHPFHISDRPVWDSWFGGGSSKPKLIGPPVSAYLNATKNKAPLIGPSVNLYLRSMHAANAELPSAAQTISDAANKAHDAASTQSSAASQQQSAIDTFGRYVDTFGQKVADLSTNLDPSHVHHTATKGLHHNVARK